MVRTGQKEEEKEVWIRVRVCVCVCVCVFWRERRVPARMKRDVFVRSSRGKKEMMKQTLMACCCCWCCCRLWIGGSSFISLASALDIAFLLSRHKNSIRYASGLAEREKIHNRERAEDANLNIDTNRCSNRIAVFRICVFFRILLEKTLIKWN